MRIRLASGLLVLALLAPAAAAAEADLYGLQAAREPDGFAEVALKLSEYRKLEPGPLETAAPLSPERLEQLRALGYLGDDP